MVEWECPTNPREASGSSPEAVHAILAVVVDIPPSGLLGEPATRLAYTLAGALTVGLALVELSRLEHLRPSLAAFAQSSVFAAVDADGADCAPSPLGSTDNGGTVDADQSTPEGSE